MPPAPPRTLIAGNWKMHGLQAQLGEIAAMALALGEDPSGVDVLVCVPATLIAGARQAAGPLIRIGGRIAAPRPPAPSPATSMPRCCATLGRQALFLATPSAARDITRLDAIVAAKVAAAWRHGLTTIVCLGETQAQRRDGAAIDVCAGQLAASLPDMPAGVQMSIAYEPLWAIGSGAMPTREQIVEVLAPLRRALDARFGSAAALIRLLYGGSVRSENTREILDTPYIDGVLVGGASLLAEQFNAIIDVARERRLTPNA